MKTKYYSVIGNRDYIKIDEVKRPFWEFLDTQPDGFLSSLVYKRKDTPKAHMIWDCGAWSYKNGETPKLGSRELTPDVAMALYLECAKAGHVVIAPDHMLIPGVGDLDARRKINANYAREFLSICDGGFVPMACIHGMDTDERLNNAVWLAEIGYRYLAIGGIAARASQKRVVVETVSRIRRAVPGVFLHVLGLSSPDYMRMWTDIGIDSSDGSSHFKQAFTAGAYFMHQNGKLIKYQAARVSSDSKIVIGSIPNVWCECTACAALRDQGIDTRTYGSNENNMGRAAHNLNKLMEAHAWVLSKPSSLLV